MGFNEDAIAAAKAAVLAAERRQAAIEAAHTPSTESAKNRLARLKFEGRLGEEFRSWVRNLRLRPGDFESEPTFTSVWCPARMETFQGSGLYSDRVGGTHTVMVPAGHEANVMFMMAGHKYTGTFSEREGEPAITVQIWIAPDPTQADAQFPRNAFVVSSKKDIGEALIEENRRLGLQ
jgi:hypothetical protein